VPEVDLGRGSPTGRQRSGQNRPTAFRHPSPPDSKKAYIGGGITKGLGAKTPWLQIDPKGTDKLSQKLAPLVTSLASASASSDPAASLSSLAGARATVTTTSATSTTYKVKLTAAQLAEMAKKQPALARAGGQALTFDYTVTSAGLPQKVSITVRRQDDRHHLLRLGCPGENHRPAGLAGHARERPRGGRLTQGLLDAAAEVRLRRSGRGIRRAGRRGSSVASRHSPSRAAGEPAGRRTLGRSSPVCSRRPPASAARRQ